MAMVALADWSLSKTCTAGLTSPAPEAVRWRDSDGQLVISRQLTAGGNYFTLHHDSDLAIDVHPNRRIVARHAANVPQNTINHFLSDQVIPRLIAHTGSFVFHAGAVKVGRGAAVFMGPSGRGKSTLTASFNEAGVPLIGDDAMVLSMPDNVPHLRPVYPSLRLFPDSLEALMPGAATAGPVAHYSTKQRIDVDVPHDAAAAPLPIRAIFAIAPPAGDEPIRLRRLAAAEACMTLVESSFALDPTDLGQARRRLEDASALARLLPAFEISYPRDYARLPEVQSAILDQVAQLQAA